MTGKEKCEFLRTIRVNMAAKNGIPYTPKECNHEGDCMGTCPLCEFETKDLMEKLQKKSEIEGTIIIDSESINKLEQLYGQEQKLQNNGDRNVVGKYPEHDVQQHNYTCLAGDVSNDN